MDLGIYMWFIQTLEEPSLACIYVFQVKTHMRTYINMHAHILYLR